MKVEGSDFNVIPGISKFVSLKINSKKSNPVILSMLNPWALKRESRTLDNYYGSIKDTRKGISIKSSCSNVDINFFIAGYDHIQYGKGTWNFHTFEYETKLGRAKDYSKMKISTAWDFIVKRGSANFSFDVWLTKKDETNKALNDDLEIMVWADYNFDLPYDKIYETKDFIVKYVKKEGEHNWHWITFVYKNKNKKHLEFDLAELIKICKEKIKDLDNYFIRDIELGVEYSNNTDVEANIKRLTFDFENNEQEILTAVDKLTQEQ